VRINGRRAKKNPFCNKRYGKGFYLTPFQKRGNVAKIYKMAQKKIFSSVSYIPYDPIKQKFVVNGKSRKRLFYSKNTTGATTFDLFNLKKTMDRLLKKNKNLKVAEIILTVELTNLP
jgi:hypothetical protein